MKQRVYTSLLLAPIVLLVSCFTSPYPFFIVCLVTATLGFWELRNLLNVPKTLPVLTLVSVVLPFYGSQIQHNRPEIQICLYAAVFFLIGAVSVWRASLKSIESTALTDLAGLWISMPLVILMMIHQITSKTEAVFHWRTILLLFFLPVWLGDIAGLFIGKRFGKRLLWPKVSPGKTIVGAVANLLISVGCATALYPIVHPDFRIQMTMLAALGVISSLFGQAGDLFESFLKRQTGQKDSGNLLPGHGGLLDRIDSLLFSAPAVALFLIWLQSH